ncbi:conserved hypothetical protein [Methylobacterium sp. 4-46]|uniref:hypothetical protein n=1 Tax=unclassified Methylobacterium TaxID=2615210 RepID=UPI000152D7C1|nr:MULTISPECIES: hypothetical protein [Methylobacterium]ACA14727.1 conserved hypothetical protein [Methylobacterium sp. 4-46]WFT80478.1 hypothetical protein QA634_00715 [Methylobacterium nodulans]
MVSAFARAALVALLLPAPAVLAAGAQEANDAYAAAKALSDKAAANKNQWPATATALAAAKAAAEAGRYDEALARAREAEALARASIDQTEREKTAWKNAVIR